MNIETISLLFDLIKSACATFESRRKIKTTLNYFGYNHNSGLALAYMQFDNLSSSDISVTDVSLLVDNKCYPCQKLPVNVVSKCRRIGNKEFSRSDIYNLPFPVYLPGFGGHSGYLLFQIPEESVPPASTPQKFLISTSRGSSFQAALKPDREYRL